MLTFVLNGTENKISKAQDRGCSVFAMTAEYNHIIRRKNTDIVNHVVLLDDLFGSR